MNAALDFIFTTLQTSTTNKGGKKTGRPRRKAKDANFVLQLTNRAKKP
jgi:hypothetical protein